MALDGRVESSTEQPAKACSRNRVPVVLHPALQAGGSIGAFQSLWKEIYKKDCPTTQNGLPLGDIKTYLSRAWCRFEILASLAPKKFSDGSWRQGPVGLHCTYHHEPDDPLSSVGPLLNERLLLNPLDDGAICRCCEEAYGLPHDCDKELLAPLVNCVMHRFQEYLRSGSTTWDMTIRIEDLPRWIVERVFTFRPGPDQPIELPRAMIRFSPLDGDEEDRVTNPIVGILPNLRISVMGGSELPKPKTENDQRKNSFHDEELEMAAMHSVQTPLEDTPSTLRQSMDAWNTLEGVRERATTTSFLKMNPLGMFRTSPEWDQPDAASFNDEAESPAGHSHAPGFWVRPKISLDPNHLEVLNETAEL